MEFACLMGIFLICMWPCVWLAVAVHELGHLFFAWLLGCKPFALVIGSPYKPALRFSIGNFEFMFTPYIWDGQVVLAHVPESRVVLAVVVAAGPVANLAAFLAVFFWRGLKDLGLFSEDPGFTNPSTYWLLFLAVNLSYGVTQLIPVSWVSGDGVELLKIIRGSK
ncbi:MAG TPA: hypothetical protein VD967_00270 [Candidatus Paceibacterota bacterium]|nr:hypothetical protein [Candidatus Paceibacterota bacterium]